MAPVRSQQVERGGTLVQVQPTNKTDSQPNNNSNPSFWSPGRVSRIIDLAQSTRHDIRKTANSPRHTSDDSIRTRR